VSRGVRDDLRREFADGFSRDLLRVRWFGASSALFDAFVVVARHSLLIVNLCLELEYFSHLSEEFSISSLILFPFLSGVNSLFLFRRTREVLA